MASAGQTITKQSVVDEELNRIRTPGYNACVWHSSSYPGNSASSRINLSQLAGRQITGSFTGTSISGVSVNANTIKALAQLIAVRCTVYRKVRSGLKVNSFGTGQSASTSNASTTDDLTAVTRLIDTYINTPSWTAANTAAALIVDNNKISAAQLNTLYSTYEGIVDNWYLSDTYKIDLRVCHSSCHNSCHSSRGRR